MPVEPEVYTITEAKVGISQDQQGRQRRYLISMSIRTLCFISAIFTQGALRWTLMVGAVLLPYFSVVVANAGRERKNLDAPDYVQTPMRTALGKGTDTNL